MASEGDTPYTYAPELIGSIEGKIRVTIFQRPQSVALELAIDYAVAPGEMAVFGMDKRHAERLVEMLSQALKRL